MQSLVSEDMKKHSTGKIQRHITLIQDDMEHCCTPCRYACISEAMQQIYDNHPPARIQTLLLQFKEKCEKRSNETFVQKLKELLFVN
ncbi:hypothetical protein [Methanolobus bombayensis]|uniref:hypothetical protein n=1 Tax=Methanolobus bombayensis TaxID=38023 RepID=UPI001AE8B58C|nr:hypothetical protein [Methanolobus bombayensis]MBP1907858.1 hypothetical protein [Methanolobus bombayensis]